MRKLFLLCAGAVALALAPASQATTAGSAHGDFIHMAAPNESLNWFGYNQGSVEQGGKLFNSITGNWKVPTVTQHTKGEAEFSSDWIGIGGGCVDASCNVGDSTLIQTGTEQDVNGDGSTAYSAWWEVIPGPSITIDMTIKPGDLMHASIAELVPNSNVWTITLQDVTRNETFTQTVPYSSSHLTAEWIEETPLVIDTSATLLAPLPNASRTPFTKATTNGQPANLQTSEQVFLVDSNLNVIGSVSKPNSTHDGFYACAWKTRC